MCVFFSSTIYSFYIQYKTYVKMSYWSQYRKIRKNVSSTILSCEEEIASSAKVQKCLDQNNSECQPQQEMDSGPIVSDNNSLDSLQSEQSAVPEDDWYETMQTIENEEYLDVSSDDNAGSDLDEIDELTEEEKAENLGFELGLWASSFGISIVALSALLAVLRVYYPSLPKDPRTLLKTPRQTIVRQIDGGTYFHFGIMKAICQSKQLLEYFATNIRQCLLQVPNICLQINIDGLPLFKSASTQFWPILGRVCSPVQTDPFMIGLFCGEQKPQDLDEYFHDFVEDMHALNQGPVDFPVDGQKIPVRVSLSCFICDTPARARSTSRFTLFGTF